MRQESIDKHVKDLTTLREALGKRVHKLENLKQKLHVNLRGDTLGAHYEMGFSHIPKQKSKVENSIIDEFCEEYGLSLIDDLCKVERMLDFFESVNSTVTYCEVDLLGMTDQKEPIKC